MIVSRHLSSRSRVPGFTARAWLQLTAYDSPIEPSHVCVQRNVWTVPDDRVSDGGSSKSGAAIGPDLGANSAQDMEREQREMRAALRAAAPQKR
jgi:hypothetical protein